MLEKRYCSSKRHLQRETVSSSRRQRGSPLVLRGRNTIMSLWGRRATFWLSCPIVPSTSSVLMLSTKYLCLRLRKSPWGRLLVGSTRALGLESRACKDRFWGEGRRRRCKVRAYRAKNMRNHWRKTWKTCAHRRASSSSRFDCSFTTRTQRWKNRLTSYAVRNA